MNKRSQIDRDKLYEQALKTASAGQVKMTQTLLEQAEKFEPLSESQQAKIDEALAKAWGV